MLRNACQAGTGIMWNAQAVVALPLSRSVLHGPPPLPHFSQGAHLLAGGVASSLRASPLLLRPPWAWIIGRWSWGLPHIFSGQSSVSSSQDVDCGPYRVGVCQLLLCDVFSGSLNHQEQQNQDGSEAYGACQPPGSGQSDHRRRHLPNSQPGSCSPKSQGRNDCPLGFNLPSLTISVTD